MNICRNCWHCIKKVYLIQSNSFWCRVNQKIAYPGTYGPGHRRGRGLIYIDYPHDWGCWTSKDPVERERNSVKYGSFDEFVVKDVE